MSIVRASIFKIDSESHQISVDAKNKQSLIRTLEKKCYTLKRKKRNKLEKIMQIGCTRGKKRRVLFVKEVEDKGKERGRGEGSL